MEKKILTIAGILAGLAVALGAFGAHVLKSRLSVDMLSVFETGVRYQMYHAIALAISALAYKSWESRSFILASWFFLAGILLFSGSLYALSTIGYRLIGIITPFGGLCFLTGWTLFVLGALKARQ